MIRPVRCKKIACYPVGCDPVECVSQYPVAEFKLDRCIIDYETGEEMGAVLPAVNGKNVIDVFGNLRIFGADTPGYTGDGIEECGQVINMIGGGNRPEDWSTSYYSYQKDALSLQGWSFHKATAIAATPSSWHRVAYNGDAIDRTLDAGEQYVYYFVFAESTTDKARAEIYAGSGALDAVVTATLSTLGVVVSGVAGCTVNDTKLTKNGGVYMLAVKITPTASHTNDSVGVGCMPTVTGDYFYVAHAQKVKTQYSPCIAMNLSGSTQRTVTRATEGGAADNGLSVGADEFPEIFAMLADKGRINYKATPKFDDSDVTAAINLLSAGGTVEDLLYLDGSGNLAATDGTNVATCPVSFSDGDALDVDIIFDNDTGKMHIECNGTVGTEVDFLGWDLSLGKVVDIWSFPDGCSVKVGPTRAYYDVPEVA